MIDKYIYSTYDAGEVAIFDDLVYIKEGQTYRKPDRSIKSTDVINIQSVTFNRDDNNELNGGVHSTWSQVEMGISNLTKFTSRQWNNASYGIDGVVTPLTTEFTYLDWDATFTAPQDGIARVICYSSVAFDRMEKILINGVRVKLFLPANTTLKDANAYKLMAGDVIKVPDFYSRIFFLPYEYNLEDGE